jgi:hypothetical protein
VSATATSLPEAAVVAPVHTPRRLIAATPSSWRRWKGKLRRRQLLLGLLFSAMAVVACWWAWADAWSLVDFTGGRNFHVLLAPFAVVFLAWVRRDRLPHVRIAGRWTGFAAAAAGLLLLIGGEQWGISVAYHLGALLLAVGAAVSVCGRGIVLRFLPAAFATTFLLPLPGRIADAIAVPLQAVTARLAVALIKVCGGEVSAPLVDSAAPGSDALHAAAALFVFAFMFVYTQPLRERFRYILLLLAPLVAVLLAVPRLAFLIWSRGQLLVQDQPFLARAENAAWQFGGVALLPVGLLVLMLIAAAMQGLFDLRIYRYRLASSAA